MCAGFPIWSMIPIASCSMKPLEKFVLFREHKDSDLDFNREPARDYLSFLHRILDCPPKLNDHERKQKRNRIISSDSTIRSRGNKLSWDVKTRRQLPMLEQTTSSGPLKIQLKAALVCDTRDWENYEITIAIDMIFCSNKYRTQWPVIIRCVKT